jgi:hypothetical protein
MHIIVSIELTFAKKLPEVLAASGIKPTGLTDRRIKEPQSHERKRLVAMENLYWLNMPNGKIVCRCARTYEGHRGKINKRSTRKE